MKHGGFTYYQDEVVFRKHFPDGRCISQGKRLPKKHAFSQKEGIHLKKIYVKYGLVALVNALRQSGHQGTLADIDDDARELVGYHRRSMLYK